MGAYSKRALTFLEALAQRIRDVSTGKEKVKWCEEVTNLKVGDVVFITDDNVAPLQWPLERISYVNSGPDTFVRVVKVRTLSGIYNRAVHKLKRRPLPSD